jgi:hypothetical protein
MSLSTKSVIERSRFIGSDHSPASNVRNGSKAATSSLSAGMSGKRALGDAFGTVAVGKSLK